MELRVIQMTFLKHLPIDFVSKRSYTSFGSEDLWFKFMEIGIKVVVVNISIRHNLKIVLFSLGDHSYNVNNSRECLR